MLHHVYSEPLDPVLLTSSRCRVDMNIVLSDILRYAAGSHQCWRD